MARKSLCAFTRGSEWEFVSSGAWAFGLSGIARVVVLRVRARRVAVVLKYILVVLLDAGREKEMKRATCLWK